MSRQHKSRTLHTGRRRETNSVILRQAILRLLDYHLRGSGEIAFPAVPALLDHYVETCRGLFAQLGRRVSTEELAGLARLLLPALEEGYRVSSRSEVLVRFETLPPPGNSLRFTVQLLPQSPEDRYRLWADTRTTPLFGARPDAKVLETAHGLGAPPDVAVLDVGAGNGRNALPLARAGFVVDALEPAPALVAALRHAASAEQLTLRVFEGVIEDTSLELPAGRYQLVFLAEVVSTHVRDVAALAAVLERASSLLRESGYLLFDMFVCLDGYKPDAVARQMSNVAWCPIFTASELERVIQDLPLERVSQEAVLDYERQASEGSLERAGWFEGWAAGLNLFDLPSGRAPIEQRWYLFRKRG